VGAQPPGLLKHCPVRESRHTLERAISFFDHPVTSFEVFDTLANGRGVRQELVVPEGFTMFRYRGSRGSEGFLTRDEFLSARA